MFFFFNDTATTDIYTLSLPDALPIFAHPGRRARDDGRRRGRQHHLDPRDRAAARVRRLRSGESRARDADAQLRARARAADPRSEEHTSELQSRQYLVCRLLLEKKKYV